MASCPADVSNIPCTKWLAVDRFPFNRDEGALRGKPGRAPERGWGTGRGQNKCATNCFTHTGSSEVFPRFLAHPHDAVGCFIAIFILGFAQEKGVGA
jgi:hypothetical protein